MLIKFDKIRKIYHLGEIEIKTLNGISFEIEEGEFISIMGHSGSVKTTLLDMLGCLVRPTSGEYFLDEENVENLDDKQLAGLRNSKMGFVFQNFNLLTCFTALENVELPLVYAGISRKERRDRSLKALELLIKLNTSTGEYRVLDMFSGSKPVDCVRLTSYSSTHALI